MKYQSLKKLYYKITKDEFISEYEMRFNSPSTIKFPLNITSKHGNTYQLFFMTLPETLVTIENISSKINQINNLSNDLTNAFINDYVSKLLVNEIIATNEIEGVYTKKEDLEKALINIDDKTQRFHSIVNKYKKILSDEDTRINTAKDIRTIYDELFINELDEKDMPDGKIFRSEHVSVYRRSGNGKPIHSGLFPEQSIIDAINNWLLFLKNDDFNFYIKLAVAHYYLGYIHPFYDGNGRLSRFLSTKLIAKEKSMLLAFKISTVIKNNIMIYDESFDISNADKNCGDMTIFVNMFLNILSLACDEIADNLNYYVSRVKKAHNFITNHLTINNKLIDALFIVYQADLLEINIKVSEVSKNISKSKTATRSDIKELIDLGYLKRGGNGDSYSIYLTNKLKDELKSFYA